MEKETFGIISRCKNNGIVVVKPFCCYLLAIREVAKIQSVYVSLFSSF